MPSRVLSLKMLDGGNGNCRRSSGKPWTSKQGHQRWYVILLSLPDFHESGSNRWTNPAPSPRWRAERPSTAKNAYRRSFRKI